MAIRKGFGYFMSDENKYLFEFYYPKGAFKGVYRCRYLISDNVNALRFDGSEYDYEVVRVSDKTVVKSGGNLFRLFVVRANRSPEWMDCVSILEKTICMSKNKDH